MIPSSEQDRGDQSGVAVSEAVVLLHGLLRTSASMRVMERALITSGYRTLNLDYDSRRKSLEALSEEIRPAIEVFCAERSEQVHFVTHSMGGLLARVYLARHRPPRLGRVVMLGPPNDGSPLADLLHRSAMFRMVFGPAGQQLTTRYAAILRDICGLADFEVGIIAGTRSANILSSGLVFHEPNDGKVAVRSTRLDGMADHITIPATHAFMMRNHAVVSATLAFLRNGNFASERAGSPRACTHAKAIFNPKETIG